MLVLRKYRHYCGLSVANKTFSKVKLACLKAVAISEFSPSLEQTKQVVLIKFSLNCTKFYFYLEKQLDNSRFCSIL